MDKFSSSPTANNNGKEAKGVNCRRYYQAFLKLWEQMAPKRSELQKDRLAEQLLQRLVERHFLFSLRESRRSTNPALVRHRWNIRDKGALYLVFPKSMEPHKRSQWLEMNVDPNIDLEQPGVKENIQALVDSSIPFPCLIDDYENLDSHSLTPFEEALISEEDSFDMAAYVAQEKADNIDRQRPAIRALGKSMLIKLIHAVFENLITGVKSDEELAEAFGLSKATYSRFCGSQWFKGLVDGQNIIIPDLWRNLCSILLKVPILIEAARNSGIWYFVSTCAETGNPRLGRSES
jgi:hypothetical protein